MAYTLPAPPVQSGLLPSVKYRKKKRGYTHSERQIGKSTYPDDSIQLGHGHLLGTFNSLSYLLLMLQDKNTPLGPERTAQTADLPR